MGSLRLTFLVVVLGAGIAACSDDVDPSASSGSGSGAQTGTGGNAGAGGSGGSGQGGEGGSDYDPCAGKSCGQACTTCDTTDPSCVPEPDTVCDATGCSPLVGTPLC